MDVGAAAPSAIGPRGPRGVQKKFPARVSEIAKTVGPGKTCELWFTDESRVGQKGRLTRVWHTKGDRPEGLRDHRFRSAWIFGAVCPERDTGEALVCTHIGTASMNAFLAELAKAIPEDRHAIVLMDQAGWHLSGTLAVPANITLVPLPPYSPELNPIERFWQHLKDRWLSNRVFETLDDVVQACCDAWNAALAEIGTVSSVCACSWAKV